MGRSRAKNCRRRTDKSITASATHRIRAHRSEGTGCYVSRGAGRSLTVWYVQLLRHILQYTQSARNPGKKMRELLAVSFACAYTFHVLHKTQTWRHLRQRMSRIENPLYVPTAITSKWSMQSCWSGNAAGASACGIESGTSELYENKVLHGVIQPLPTLIPRSCTRS